MPTLKQITCSIELNPSGTKLKEYGKHYTDGAVEAFIAVPETRVPFSVHISSEGYIAPGLAVFLYMDGKYMCNRNRLYLPLPGDGIKKEKYEVDFSLRQKEEKDTSGKFIGRQWTFAELNVEHADTENNLNTAYFRNVGTIEVVILRCKSDDGEFAHTPERSKYKAAPAKSAMRSKQESEFGGLVGLFDGANDPRPGYADDFAPVDGHGNVPNRPPSGYTWDSGVGQFVPDNVMPHHHTYGSDRLGGMQQDDFRDDRSAIYNYAPRPKFDQPRQYGRDDTNPADLPNYWPTAEEIGNQRYGGLQGEARKQHRQNLRDQGQFYTISAHGPDMPMNNDAYNAQYPKPNDLKVDPAMFNKPSEFNNQSNFNNQPQKVNLAQQHPTNSQPQFNGNNPQSYSQAVTTPEQELQTLENMLKRKEAELPEAEQWLREAENSKSSLPSELIEERRRHVQLITNLAKEIKSRIDDLKLNMKGANVPAGNMNFQGPYQNAPYQSTPYQNNPYQNTPYQNNPYQNAPYPGQYPTGHPVFGAPPINRYNGGSRSTAREHDQNDAWGAKNDNNDAGGGWGKEKQNGDDDNNQAPAWEDQGAGDNNGGSQKWGNDQNDDWNKPQDNENNDAGGGWDQANNDNGNNNAGGGWDQANNERKPDDKGGDQAWDNPPTNGFQQNNNNQQRSQHFAASSVMTNAQVARIKPYWKDWSKDSKTEPSPNTKKKAVVIREPHEYVAEQLPPVPAEIAGNADRGIQVGRGATYTHRCHRPQYLDTMESPYAIFSFKYRSKAALEKILDFNIEQDMAPIEQQAERDMLANMPKEELIRAVINLKIRSRDGGGQDTGGRSQGNWAQQSSRSKVQAWGGNGGNSGNGNQNQNGGGGGRSWGKEADDNAWATGGNDNGNGGNQKSPAPAGW